MKKGKKVKKKIAMRKTKKRIKCGYKKEEVKNIDTFSERIK